MIDCFRTSLVLLVAAAFAVTGCDQSSQNVEPIPGDTYIITQESSSSGEAVSGSLVSEPSVTAPDTVVYYVRGFTIDKDYTWTVNGTEVSSAVEANQTYVWERREGEFITVVYSEDDPLTSIAPTGETEVTISVNAAGDDINEETITVPVSAP